MLYVWFYPVVLLYFEKKIGVYWIFWYDNNLLTVNDNKNIKNNILYVPILYTTTVVNNSNKYIDSIL